MSNTTDSTYYIRPIAGYVPDLPLNIVGLTAWAILAVCLWTRFFIGKQKYMLSIVIGVTCMVFGFALRIPLHYSPNSLNLGIVMILFTLLPPCAFLAQGYIVLPRLAIASNVLDCLVISHGKLLKIFLTSDIVTFLFQAAGGGLQAVGGSTTKIGDVLVLIGLSVQTASFILFTIVFIVFVLRFRSRWPAKWNQISVQHQHQQPGHHQMSTYSQHKRSSSTSNPLVGKLPESPSDESMYAKGECKWWQDRRVLIIAMSIACVGIIIRSIYRVAEMAGGYNSYLSLHEWNFYVFDTAPLYVAAWTYAVVWPAFVLEYETAAWGANAA